MRNEEITKLVRKIGQGPSRILLESLAKNKQFEAAVGTPIGVEIMTDLVHSLRTRVGMVIAEKDTPEIRAEIRVLMDILDKWSKRINKADEDQIKFNRIIEG